MTEKKERNTGYTAKYWLDESDTVDCRDNPAIVIEVSVLDTRTGMHCLSRRCISEITCVTMVDPNTQQEDEEHFDKVRAEASKMADELENFVLIGVR